MYTVPHEHSMMEQKCHPWISNHLHNITRLLREVWVTSTIKGCCSITVGWIFC